jgi:hypothetical protein
MSGPVGEPGFHAGELAVQQRAGVREEAARLTRMLDPADLRGGLGRFLADRTFAVLTARDHDQRLWISPLAGSPGFLSVRSATTLDIAAAPLPGDPLHGLSAGQPAGLLVVEFAARPGAEDPLRRGTGLTAEDRALIRAADTFFLGTTHPERGNDASHRGGTPGFIRVEDEALWWPDYPGNNMFNSFGNLAVDPAAALLFADFGTGRTLHLSGTAAVDWTGPGIAGDDGGTGRRVRFTPQRVVSGRLLPARTVATGQAYPTPPLTG